METGCCEDGRGQREHSTQNNAGSWQPVRLLVLPPSRRGTTYTVRYPICERLTQDISLGEMVSNYSA